MAKGTEIQLKANRNTTVLSVRKELTSRTGIPLDNIQLRFRVRSRCRIVYTDTTRACMWLAPVASIFSNLDSEADYTTILPPHTYTHTHPHMHAHAHTHTHRVTMFSLMRQRSLQIMPSLTSCSTCMNLEKKSCMSLRKNKGGNKE